MNVEFLNTINISDSWLYPSIPIPTSVTAEDMFTLLTKLLNLLSIFIVDPSIDSTFFNSSNVNNESTSLLEFHTPSTLTILV